MKGYTYKRSRAGDRTVVVGPFPTTKATHRALAQSLVDNGYEANTADAAAFAARVTVDGPYVHHDLARRDYWIERVA